MIARGGYGREEVYFRSDVDIQVVAKSDPINEEAEDTEQIVKHLEYLFIHQNIFQTSASSCYAEIDTVGKDLNTEKLPDFFSLLENRLVAGSNTIYAEFKSIVKTAALLHRESLLKHCYQRKKLLRRTKYSVSTGTQRQGRVAPPLLGPGTNSAETRFGTE